MKDQLKRTFSEASRYLLTRNEEFIKTGNTFLTEDMSHMTIQEHKPVIQLSSKNITFFEQATNQLTTKNSLKHGNYQHFNNKNSRQYDDSIKA